MDSKLTLKVSEVFYSLQGEGARAGEASIFVRLSGCSAKHACYASGVVCDTEFESGEEMSIPQILVQATLAIGRVVTPKALSGLGADEPRKYLWVVWTGGEPLDQLTSEIVYEFSKLGYKQAIETSGVKALDPEIAKFLDWIVVSPKVAEHVLVKNFPELKSGDDWTNDGHYLNVHELRYVRHSGQPGIPEPALKAKYYYLSPHSDGAEINQENLKHCIKLCLENPQWRLSVQQHKLFGIL